jgi:hypothetical protein
MKVIVTETTIVSYQIDVPVADTALEAARLARNTFVQTLDPIQFAHSVIHNSIEYSVLDLPAPQRFVDGQLEAESR